MSMAKQGKMEVPAMAHKVKDPDFFTAIAWIAAVTRFQSLAQELPHASGAAKKKKKTNKQTKKKPQCSNTVVIC